MVEVAASSSAAKTGVRGNMGFSVDRIDTG
jgi:hypothetical protein